MLRETIANVPVNLAEGLARVPKVKVVPPTLQVPVYFPNQLRGRLTTLTMNRHLVQLLAIKHVLVVEKRESQKVQTRSFFLQIHRSRFLPIDLQTQPAFEFRFYPSRQTSPLIARQHHEIVGIAHQLGPRPLSWSIGPLK